MMSVEIAVMIRLDEIKRIGPPDMSLDRRLALAEIIGEQGDIILYADKKRTPHAFTALVETLVILAHAPGGVLFCGHRYQVTSDEDVKS